MKIVPISSLPFHPPPELHTPVGISSSSSFSTASTILSGATARTSLSSSAAAKTATNRIKRSAVIIRTYSYDAFIFRLIHFLQLELQQDDDVRGHGGPHRQQSGSVEAEVGERGDGALVVKAVAKKLELEELLFVQAMEKLN